MVILTGGAGFIGSVFLAQLNAQGVDDVLVVDNLGSGDKWKNLRLKRYSDYIHKNRFYSLLQSGRLPERVDAVVHLGACSSTTERDGEYMLDTNYHFSRALAEWALSRDIRFIYASSAATYGDGADGFSDDDELTPKLRPLNVYGYSKQLFDCWALRSGAVNKAVGLRFFNVFGPNEYHKGDMSSVVFKSFHQIRSTGEMILFKSARPDYADGEQMRDFIYVKDCCTVMWSLLQARNVHGIFNLGTGQARTWNDLAHSVFSALKMKPEIRYVDMPESIRDRYQYFTEAKMTKLQSALGDLRFTPLETAVADYVAHLQSADPHV